MTWIDVRQRMPTKEDADKHGNVLWRLCNGDTFSTQWNAQESMDESVAWMPIPPYTPLPEIPEGYRLLRHDEYGQRQNSKAMYLLSGHEWRAIAFVEDAYHEGSTYIVPTEPEPQYRPFKNAEEFRPHRDRWWRQKSDGDDRCCPPGNYFGDGYQKLWTWKGAFQQLEFEDGTPFGVEE